MQIPNALQLVREDYTATKTIHEEAKATVNRLTQALAEAKEAVRQAGVNLKAAEDKLKTAATDWLFADEGMER